MPDTHGFENFDPAFSMSGFGYAMYLREVGDPRVQFAGGDPSRPIGDTSQSVMHSAAFLQHAPMDIDAPISAPNIQ
jgi:hypothetical protein